MIIRLANWYLSVGADKQQRGFTAAQAVTGLVYQSLSAIARAIIGTR
jgi:hypothetical protein